MRILLSCFHLLAKTAIALIAVIVLTACVQTDVRAAATGCADDFPICLTESPEKWESGQCYTPQEVGGIPSCVLPNGHAGQSCCNVEDPIEVPIFEVCTAPKVRMCNMTTPVVGVLCACINDTGTCGGFKEPGCYRYTVTHDRSYYCEEGLTPTKPNEATGNNTIYCVNTQEEADDVAAGLALLARPAFNLCQQAGDPEGCSECASSGGVWTAIGCVPTTRQHITRIVLTLAISIAGGIVLLRVLQAAFMLSTSQGEQNKVQEARDILTSSISGLLFIIFSMVLLNTIGVNILQIPGF